MLSRLLNPIPLALIAALAAVSMLVLPLRLPIGANHWDIVMHLDGAYRVSLGQVPHRDFFAPSGALPYAALAAMQALFPQAHPLLAGQLGVWFLAMLLAVAALLFPRRASPGLAAALLLPLAVAGLLPVNAIEFYPQPGVDAIGLYNRQTGFLLYALLLALIAARPGAVQAMLVGLALTGLFYTKINGFVAGVPLVLLAWWLGYIRFAGMVIAAGIVLATAAVLQLSLGLPLAYLADLSDMVRHNAGRGVARLMTLLSVKFGTVLTLALVTMAALWQSRRALPGVMTAAADGDGAEDAQARMALFLAGALPIAIWCESQNTGSQEFLFLWPILACLSAKALDRLEVPASRRAALALLALVAAASLPTAVTLIQRMARAGVGAAGYAAIGGETLAPLGRSSTKPEALDRAGTMLEHYRTDAASYQRLAAKGQMPEAILYSSIDYQALYQLDLADLMAALKAYEARSGRKLATVFTLDAADPVPLLTGRVPVKDVTVSLDPTRGFPAAQHDRLRNGLAQADSILRPLCPETPARLAIAAIAQPELARRERVALSPCWDAYLRR